jgi:hypothetical protein
MQDHERLLQQIQAEHRMAQSRLDALHSQEAVLLVTMRQEEATLSALLEKEANLSTRSAILETTLEAEVHNVTSETQSNDVPFRRWLGSSSWSKRLSKSSNSWRRRPQRLLLSKRS